MYSHTECFTSSFFEVGFTKVKFTTWKAFFPLWALPGPARIGRICVPLVNHVVGSEDTQFGQDLKQLVWVGCLIPSFVLRRSVYGKASAYFTCPRTKTREVPCVFEERAVLKREALENESLGECAFGSR